MRHKSLQILSIGMITAMLLTGCGSSDSKSTEPSATDNTGVSINVQQEETSDTATYGQIKSIDGSTITVEIGTKKQMNKSDKNDSSDTASSDKPEMPSDHNDGGTPPSGNPEMPSDHNDGGTPPSGNPEMPSDGKDMQNGDRPSMLDLTGETKSITVDSSTKITISSKDSTSGGTVSDLKEGDTISFELSSDDSTASSITVQSMQHGSASENGDKGTDQNAPAATDTAAN